MCRALLQIPFLHETNPLLISIIRTALTEKGDDEEEEQEPIVFAAIQVDELEGDVIEPEEEVSDKILFIINNLSPNNFDSKMDEMLSRWEAKYSRWFANYLVGTRVSVEPNNHQLYARLLEALHTSELDQLVLWETYNKSAGLLNAERSLTDSADRSTLKNLGSWLGRLTVARDLPVRHRNLSIKDLLLQGYDAKRLPVALPFVCKIMEQCASSRVFHPPNPWLMAILRFMAELYAFGDLKLNLKFEIEVLCKSLDVALDTLEPTRILRSRTPPHAAAQPAIDLGAGGGFAGQPRLQQSDQQASDAFLRRIDELVGQLPEYLSFSIPLFATNPSLKRIAHLAIDRAVREIINPVVERSVTIAGISSRDLLMKDFGMESDENKLRQAAHLMVQKLAGSLALVTCKEPLRTSMTNNMRLMMQQAGFADVSTVDLLSEGISANLFTTILAFRMPSPTLPSPPWSRRISKLRARSSKMRPKKRPSRTLT
jgi:CCR4-NOT transcription complex subunit 1